MKRSLLFALIIIGLSCSGRAQLCVNLPTTLSEIELCNLNIAKTFAPQILQFASICEDQSYFGDADRITKANWDNDWVATNSWQSFESFSNPPNEWDTSPFCYYAVTWTPEIWIVVYSYYYPRDWATTSVGCDEDQHEGDMQRVMVVVKRPTSASDAPEDLLLGFITEDITNCISSNPNSNKFNALITDSSFPEVAIGVHSRVGSASGSHHYYSSAESAYEDVKTDEIFSSACRPVPTSLINYLPANASSNVSSVVPIIIEDDPSCLLYPPCAFPYSMSNIQYCSSHDEFYGLIDIFNSSQGLWEQRNNNEMFSAPPFYDQHLLSDDGGGVDGQGLYGDQFPATPWTGSIGLNPLERIFRDINSFNCDCNSNPNCEDFTVTQCIYEYNPYLCELYEIVFPEEFEYSPNNWVLNPYQNGNDVILNLKFRALGVPANSDISWSWDFPGFSVQCTGCSTQPANDILLKITGATVQQIKDNSSNIKIQAVTNMVECGEITQSTSLQDIINGFVTTDGNCTKMVFQIPEDHHLDGNQYEWDFPQYNNLKSTSTDGRRVEFNTQNVLLQTTSTNNPTKEMPYTLTVSNPSFPSDVEVTGKEKIPDCTFGTGPGLRIYPNPAQDNVSLGFENIDIKEGYNVHIYNHQSNLVSSAKYADSDGQPSLDVSKFKDGLYFICVLTKDGKMLTEKFCIDRH